MTVKLLQSISPFLSNVFLQNNDVEILRELNSNRVDQLDQVFQFITNSVSFVAWGVPTLLLLIAIIVKQSQLRKKSILLLSSVLLSSLISTTLKYIIDRPRPFTTHDFIEKLSVGGSPSFPSGHTTEAFAFAVALCIAYPRWYIIIPSLLWASAIGYTRISLGVHYPSDVLAGATIGIATAYFCFRAFRYFKTN
mgnify:CR=1 FL=1